MSGRRSIPRPSTDLPQLADEQPAAQNLGGLTRAQARPTRRDRSFENQQRAEGRVITLRMSPETIARFKQLVTDLGVVQGDLAEKLLTYAMDAAEQGYLP